MPLRSTLAALLTLFGSFPVRIGLMIVAFLLLCVIHGRINAAEDVLGNPKPEAKLPSAVQASLDKAADDIARIDARARDDANKIRITLAQRLAKAQDDATRKGDLDVALLLKSKVDELEQIVSAGKPKPAESDVSLKSRLQGSMVFAFPNGHAGQVTFANGGADVPGFHATVSYQATNAVLSWSNGTQWTITARDGKLFADASDGRTALVHDEK